MDLTLKTLYWDDPKARAAFKAFILKMHGLDFTEWEEAGYWDEAYTPFSYFDGDAVVSSVCIYLLDAVIDGESTRVAQISGVGTLPKWRRKGLNRQLAELGLGWAQGKHRGVFLFADTDAVPFYRRCGFRPIEEYVETIEVAPVPNRGGAVRLDPGQKQDLDRIYQYATERAPVSNRFSVLNAKLVTFHALHRLRDAAYEIPELDCLVFMQRENRCLRLFDIVGRSIPSLKALYPYISDAGDKRVEFHFHADRLGLEGVRSEALLGNYPFVKGTFPVEQPVFPFTSRA